MKQCIKTFGLDVSNCGVPGDYSFVGDSGVLATGSSFTFPIGSIIPAIFFGNDGFNIVANTTTSLLCAVTVDWGPTASNWGIIYSLTTPTDWSQDIPSGPSPTTPKVFNFPIVGGTENVMLLYCDSAGVPAIGDAEVSLEFTCPDCATLQTIVWGAPYDYSTPPATTASSGSAGSFSFSGSGGSFNGGITGTFNLVGFGVACNLTIEIVSKTGSLDVDMIMFIEATSNINGLVWGGNGFQDFNFSVPGTYVLPFVFTATPGSIISVDIGCSGDPGSALNFTGQFGAL